VRFESLAVVFLKPHVFCNVMLHHGTVVTDAPPADDGLLELLDYRHSVTYQKP